MGRIISVHSFRGGTGKSNTTASVAMQLAMERQKIGGDRQRHPRPRTVLSQGLRARPATHPPGTQPSPAVKTRVSQAYGVEDVMVLPHSHEMMLLASGGVFCIEHPDHELTHAYGILARDLVA